MFISTRSAVWMFKEFKKKIIPKFNLLFKEGFKG